jgi:hypothetical protein
MANSEGGTMSKEQKIDRRLLLLSPDDNVLVLRGAINAGEQIFIHDTCVLVKAPIGLGHKLAAKAIPSGSKVMKYGAPIGSATQDIAIGDHVHIHNLKSDYTPTYALDEMAAEGNDA